MSNNITSTNYHIGRPLGQFKPPYHEVDQTFAGQRLEGIEIEDADYKHCTFINLGFKEVKFKEVQFFNCIFVGCYFRRAHIINSSFQGCRFIDCEFPRIAINCCNFSYSNFSGCQILFSEIKHSLPSEPNLREDLTRNLTLESLRLGLYQEAKRYKIVRINAHEKHLKAAFCGDSKWYRDHFDMVARTGAFCEWFLSLINRWLWGYGEKMFSLLRNFALLCIIFPVLFFLCKEELTHETSKAITIKDVFYFSLENVLPAGINSHITATGGLTQLLAGLESFLGVVLIAFFAAYLFRWSIQR